MAAKGAARVVATYLAKTNADLPQKPAGAVRIVCQSDTHGRVESGYKEGILTVPEGDIYIHAGDFSSHGMKGEFQLFHDFVASLPHTYKVVIAGNHDITMDSDYYTTRGALRFHPRFPQDVQACRAIFTESKTLMYLQDSGTEIMGLRIWGAPWQPEFCDWGFNLRRGAPLKEKWDLIPTSTDVLITHGPPFGFGDRCSDGRMVGCEELLKTITERVRPSVHICGHIHEDFGVQRNDTTCFVNASTCTLKYRPTNPCVVIDIVPPTEEL